MWVAPASLALPYATSAENRAESNGPFIGVLECRP
jgi:hypothetical protein